MRPYGFVKKWTHSMCPYYLFGMGVDTILFERIVGLLVSALGGLQREVRQLCIKLAFCDIEL